MPEAAARKRLSHAAPGVWVALAPVSQRLLPLTVGDRTRAVAPTTFIARVHRPSRPPGAAVGRRVLTRCPGEEGVRPQLALDHPADHVCRPHPRIRRPWPPP